MPEYLYTITENWPNGNTFFIGADTLDEAMGYFIRMPYYVLLNTDYSIESTTTEHLIQFMNGLSAIQFIVREYKIIRGVINP